MDLTARIWDVDTGRTAPPPRSHRLGLIGGVQPRRPAIVTASWDRTARVWDTATGRNAPVIGHTSYVYDAAFSPDGERIVTASMDSTARIWDTATGQKLHRLIGHAGPVSSAAFSPDGERLLTYAPAPSAGLSAGLGAAMLWDVSTTDLVTHLGRVHNFPASAQGAAGWSRSRARRVDAGRR